MFVPAMSVAVIRIANAPRSIGRLTVWWLALMSVIAVGLSACWRYSGGPEQFSRCRSSLGSAAKPFAAGAKRSSTRGVPYWTGECGGVAGVAKPLKKTAHYSERLGRVGGRCDGGRSDYGPEVDAQDPAQAQPRVEA